MEVGAKGKELEGLARRRLNVGWIEKELSQPPGDGLGKVGGGILLRSKKGCSEKEVAFWMGRRDCDQKVGSYSVNFQMGSSYRCWL